MAPKFRVIHCVQPTDTRTVRQNSKPPPEVALLCWQTKVNILLGRSHLPKGLHSLRVLSDLIYSPLVDKTETVSQAGNTAMYGTASIDSRSMQTLENRCSQKLAVEYRTISCRELPWGPKTFR